MSNYRPDQSDRDALRVAKAQGVRLYETTDLTWSWELGGVGAYGFPTKYHAAQDALKGLLHK